MIKHTLEKTILFVLALALAVANLNAAEKPSATAPSKESKQTAPGAASTPALVDKNNEKRVKRAHHLAEKGAEQQFRNSPDGIAFKNQLASLNQEINAVYEKHLNVFRESPEKGKTLRAERDRQLQLLDQKMEKVEADYEKLKEKSQVYRAMLEKKLKSELQQVKGKQAKSPPGTDEEAETTDNP